MKFILQPKTELIAWDMIQKSDEEEDILIGTFYVYDFAETLCGLLNRVKKTVEEDKGV